MKSLVKIALAAALAAGTALAQPAGPAAGPARARVALRALQPRLLRNLNLTDAQKEQAKAILQKAREDAKPIREQLRQNRQSMAEAIKNNDTVQIQQLAAAQGNLQGQALAIQSGAMAKLYAMLTPDQQQKLAQMRQRLQQRRQRMQQRLNQRQQLKKQ